MLDVVNMVILGVLFHGFDLWSGKTKDYQVDIDCFPAKPVVLSWKNKDWLACYQDNVSKWSDMSI